MSILKYSVGIDVSMSDFKANVSIIESDQSVKVKASRTFSNSPSGHREFSIWATKNHKDPDVPMNFLMEATGVYHEQLAWFLHGNGYRVSVVLPTKAKRYLQSLGHKSKNDKIDAQGLARMCAEQNHPEWNPISPNIYTLRALTRTHEDLQVQRTGLISRLRSADYGMHEVPKVNEVNKKLLKFIEKKIKGLEREILETIEGDEVLREKYRQLTSIKGLGLMGFAVVVAETDGFSLFSNSRQLTSYAGYDIVENQSGKRSGKTRISKKGNPHIRRILNMPALNVVRHETYFRSFYERIYSNTGMKKKAHTAVQRKLLCIMYTLWIKNEEYCSIGGNMNGLSEVDGKTFFPLTKKGEASKKIAVTSTATQDRLPSENG